MHMSFTVYMALFIQRREKNPQMASSYSKPTHSNYRLFIFSVFLLSFSLLILAFTFKPPRQTQYFIDPLRLHNQPVVITIKPKWLQLIEDRIVGRKIKVGLVNVNNGDREKDYIDDMHGLAAEIVHVRFDRVAQDRKWDDYFPEWIDEDQKWGQPRCPEIPMPRMEDYRDLDVIVARVPCGVVGVDERKGIRDLFRLQVNLIVANLAMASGWVEPDDVDRTVYVVFMGSCEPMIEIFRCDDLLMHVGDYWVYKPEMRRLKQKVLMPVGSCRIAPVAYARTGKEAWRHFMPQSKLIPTLNYSTYQQREAYVTVLHSSEAYVCGAIALAQSIIQSNSTRDLVLLHDKSIRPKSLRGLRAAGWKTKWISRIRSPSARKDAYNEWNYSKLRVWQLIEYDKVIFIDSDLLVLKNIDKFFYYPQLSAAGNDQTLFNSGVMVIEPSLCMFEHLMLKSFKVASYNGGDQGFLNEIFTWWHRLPSKLNYLKVFFKTGDAKHQIPDNLYTIHYLGLKPWLCYKDYDCNWDMVNRHKFATDSAHKKWWKVHDAMPMKLQQYCRLTKHMNARIKKWRGIAKNASLANGHWKIKVKDPRQYRLIG